MQPEELDPLQPQDPLEPQEDLGQFDTSYSEFKPQVLDGSTFKQRNDPQELLYRFKLKLMKAYEVVKEVKDPDTGQIKKKRTIVRILSKGKPLNQRVNKQGVEDIMSYVETLINGHIVQGNIEGMTEFRNKMRFISNDVTCHFIAKRADWESSLKDIDILISNVINLFDLFLTRTLENEERRGYGESYKEETKREIKPEMKPNVFQKIGSALAQKGWN